MLNERLIKILGADHINHCIKQGKEYVEQQRRGAWFTNDFLLVDAYSTLLEKRF